MQQETDLIKKILFKISEDPEKFNKNRVVEGYSNNEVSDLVDELNEKGFLKTIDLGNAGFTIEGLTIKGREYLEK